MSRIGIFATQSDLTSLLLEVEANRRIHYAEAGLFDSGTIIAYRSAKQIPRLGEIDALDPNLGRILLIADVDVQFVMRTVPQRRGGVKYALDQKKNPDTVSLLPGGQFDVHTVVAGNFATCTDSPTSLALLGLVTQIANKKWSKIKSYRVGPEAEAILDAGGRLTAGLHPEYDLRR